MKKSVSIKDVAKLASVSTATVSNVYSGKKPVSEDLCERVLAAGDKLGYEMNRAASQLRTGKNKVIAVLVPDLADPFFTSVITELEAQARDTGYDIIVGNSNDSHEIEQGRLDALLSSQPAGLVVIPCTGLVPPRLVNGLNVPPFVVADRVNDTTIADTVMIDNKDAGAIAARYIAELGHTDVLLAASDLSLASIRARCDGAREVIEQFSGASEVIEVGAKPKEGAKILTHRIERHGQPTAIIGLTDMATLAVLTCLAARKIDIPEQISVVGFDDYPWMKAQRKAITAVRQPIKSIASSIWDCLSDRMSMERLPRKSIVLSTTLIVRESAAPPRSDLKIQSAADNYNEANDQSSVLKNEADNDGSDVSGVH